MCLTDYSHIVKIIVEFKPVYQIISKHKQTIETALRFHQYEIETVIDSSFEATPKAPLASGYHRGMYCKAKKKMPSSLFCTFRFMYERQREKLVISDDRLSGRRHYGKNSPLSNFPDCQIDPIRT